MAQRLKYFALLLSAFLLFGCQEEPKFDRVNAMNYSEPEYVASSQYIKKQVIKTETGGELIRTLIMEYDKKGRFILAKSTETSRDGFDTELRYDYSKGKFSSYSKLPDVWDMEGDLMLNSDGHIVRLQAQDAESTLDIQNTFENGKRVLTLFQWKTVSHKSNFLWNGDVISQIARSFYDQGGKYMSDSTSYQYDTAKKLISMTIKHEETLYQKVTFTDHNQHGDWIRALVYQDGNDEEDDLASSSSIMTREIEYF